ncbi:radical SAM protein [candidate division KSB1 bacterium]
MINFDKYRKQLLADEYNSAEMKKYRQSGIVLIYPNTYDVGISNLGFNKIYKIINDSEDFFCERGFLYKSPFETTAKSLESGTVYSKFDIIGFSINFELDLFNIVKILNNAKVPVFACDRSEKDPILIAGGNQLAINPAPLLDIFDILFIGEGEELIVKFLKTYSEKRGEKKSEILDRLKNETSILIPSKVSKNKPFQVKRAYVRDLKDIKYYPPVVTKNSHMSNSYLIETGRGCGRGCRFCAAHSIYRPVRFLDFEHIKSVIENHTEDLNRIGLVGASISDHPQLEKIVRYLAETNRKIGLSSFRPDRISEGFLKNLSQCGLKSITIAPEAGSEYLRNRINKKISDEQIFNAVKLLAASKIKSLKLYFMAGLPGETDKDIDALISMVKKIHEIFVLDVVREGRIKLSINIFVPKPFTVFQFADLSGIRDSDRKRKYIFKELRRLKNLSFSSKGKRLELIQGIIAQGTAKISVLLNESEGDYSKFLKLFRSNEDSSLIYKKKTKETPLPWEIIDNGINRSKLWNEYCRVVN